LSTVPQRGSVLSYGTRCRSIPYPGCAVSAISRLVTDAQDVPPEHSCCPFIGDDYRFTVNPDGAPFAEAETQGSFPLDAVPHFQVAVAGSAKGIKPLSIRQRVGSLSL